MCGGSPSHSGRYDLFATEGGTAAMCYIFDSLVENRLLKEGDKIALGVPVFTPYLEIPELARYNFDIEYVYGSAKDLDGNSTFQYPDEELDKLGDRSIKAFFIVNPSNPTSVEISDKSRKYLVKVVRNLNPNLMILTDDVYGTFVPGFVSLMDELPQNTLCVYSFSKYFGATGWRLGVIALYEENIYDKMIKALPAKEKEKMNELYSSLTVHPERIKFIDRLVADSRQVALNHTAGLSTPQQIQMLLFAAFALFDEKNDYKKDCFDLLQHRYALLWDGMNIPILPDPERAAYYSEIDLYEWGLKQHGQDFVDFLTKHFEPVDIVFRLAERSSIVLLNGGGFAGPEWSVRVSLANLNDEDYAVIGKEIAETMQDYVDAWQSMKR
jgi:aspartate 4-decarboxylase